MEQDNMKLTIIAAFSDCIDTTLQASNMTVENYDVIVETITKLEKFIRFGHL